MMEKHDIPTGDESDEETVMEPGAAAALSNLCMWQFPAKPEMAIFTLVDDDSDDELGNWCCLLYGR